MVLARPEAETLRSAIGSAQHAPSVHNSQPWRWEVDGATVRLYADPSRHLVATDPQGRALMLSCGTALHHLRVALAARGWASRVRHLPEPGDPLRLAELTLEPRQPERDDIELAAAIAHRRSDRRRFRSGRIPSLRTWAAAEYARRFGADVCTLGEDERARLAPMFRTAAREHAQDALYQVELATWSGHDGETGDGVPARNAAPIHTDDQLPGRAFANPALIDPAARPDGAEWLAVCTEADDRVDELRAGEALSALLLSATRLGLATCVQTEPLGVVELRERMRHSVCGDAYPQALVRTGVPLGAAPLPETPRRGVDEVAGP
ncbi:Acg family FMN-binding oxidoreductase [Nocardia sp. NPDC004068]|uniref:Acg family FMN-binding oxidoreductase n=1 Tax=Nocardia sp. NPDC004068 TaxID=3364303 RepID=UPI0036832CA5